MTSPITYDKIKTYQLSTINNINIRQTFTHKIKDKELIFIFGGFDSYKIYFCYIENNKLIYNIYDRY